jgi:hypothetical protein
MMTYYLLFAIVLVFWGTYSIIYISYLKRSSDNIKQPWVRLTPRVFLFASLLVSLTLGFSYALYERDMLEKDLTQLETYTVSNRYLQDETSSASITYVVSNYLIYFGGTYVDLDQTILGITTDAPNELIAYLTSNNIPYEFVDYSYTDLLSVQQLIITASSPVNGFIGIAINERLNKVMVTTDHPDELIDRFQTYIDQGILDIKASEGLTYRD